MMKYIYNYNKKLNTLRRQINTVFFWRGKLIKNKVSNINLRTIQLNKGMLWKSQKQNSSRHTTISFYFQTNKSSYKCPKESEISTDKDYYWVRRLKSPESKSTQNINNLKIVLKCSHCFFEDYPLRVSTSARKVAILRKHIGKWAIKSNLERNDSVAHHAEGVYRTNYFIAAITFNRRNNNSILSSIETILSLAWKSTIRIGSFLNLRHSWGLKYLLALQVK